MFVCSADLKMGGYHHLGMLGNSCILINSAAVFLCHILDLVYVLLLNCYEASRTIAGKFSD